VAMLTGRHRTVLSAARLRPLRTSRSSGPGARAEDAEPFAALGDRVRRFLEDLLARHPDETVLVVAHGDSIRVIHAFASGLTTSATTGRSQARRTVRWPDTRLGTGNWRR
jgi:broad specificity phosphatase PhoE